MTAGLRDRFGKYHVLEKIARGGMAEVYKVKTVGIAGFEKVQALKRILPHSAREGRFIRSFIDEARIAVELAHRNIVQVFDFGKADGELFLAMELIEGKDLRTAMGQAVTRELLPSIPIAAYIVAEVAAGLDYAHRKTDGFGGSLGIVHCDVSPSNVMVSTDGYVKILDFGIARATFASALERRRLRGKPRYMAPEQTLGEPPTAASDVFALGIIAWELFTGLPLYRGPDVKSILEAVRRTEPPRLDQINPEVPPEIVNAIATALARAPSARGSVADLGAACARTALAAGARVVAAWLAALDTRPSAMAVEWQADVTSISVPGPDSKDRARTGPPIRYSARSVTHSLANVPAPVADFGEGTPGFVDPAPELPARPPAPSSERAQAARPPTVPQRADRLPDGPTGGSPADPETAHARFDVSTSGSAAIAPRADPTVSPTTTATVPLRADPTDRFSATATVPPPADPTDRFSTTATVPPPADPTDRFSATATVPPPADPTDRFSTTATVPPPADPTDRFSTTATVPPPADRTVSLSTTVAVPRTAEVTASTTVRWAPAAVSSVGQLADTSPPEPSIDREGTPEEPRARSARTNPARAPAAPPPGLDDGATHHGVPPGARDQTYDQLELESDPSAGAVAGQVPTPTDEPIDDDLRAMTTGLPAERRRTVVVGGVVAGATADVRRLATRSLGELAYQRGGVVTALDDDALVIAFGLEVAGEDDVAVAMGWALDAIAMLRDAGAEHGGLVLRVGARTGVATIAAPDGTPHVPQEAIDDARLVAREASPERPMFVGGAGRLTSTLYALREVPAPRRIARRSRVIEVLGLRGFEERDRARFERRGTFVGRTAQLAELDVWFQRAVVANRRLAVLITGAAGTGKSRLVAEMIARRIAAGSSVRVVTTAASPASQLAPFSTVIDLYQAALGLPPARGRTARGQVVQRLTRMLMKAGVATERIRAVVTDLDRAMELRDGVGIGAPEVADLRPRISAGLAKVRSVMTDGERPLVTVIEDLHLADSASLEALRHMLVVSASGPELLVLTARPEGAAPPPVDAVLQVGDLVGAELRALIADRLGDAATPLNIAAVLARGGGNPLFIEELVEAVRDAGTTGEDVPASARDVIAARIDRLSVKARAALRFAAVLGSTIRVRLLEELLGEPSLDVEVAELVGAGILAPALAPGPVRQGGPAEPVAGPAPPARPDDEPAAVSSEGELYFTRGLVREVVYDSLSARAQRASHARVGRLLASRFFAGREEPPAVIAEHLERGGETAGAAAFWLRAGRLALAASDAVAAIGCFTRTLALDRELGVVPPTATSRARRRAALAGREEAHRLVGDLASDPGDLDELQRLCEGEPGRLADVAIRRAHRMLRLGDYANAGVATVVAEDHAEAASDDRLTGEALRVRGEILERLGRFDDALEVVGAARDLFHRQRLIHDEMAAMLGRGRIHLLRAHYEAARDAYRPVIRLIEQTGDPWLERIVTNHVAVIEMCLGDFPRAMASVERSLELCRRYGDRAREGDGQSVAGIILLEVGLFDRAAAMFVDALDVLSRTASRWSRADCLIYAGACDVRRGRPGGLAMLDEALAEARRLGARYLEANALVARAAAQLRHGALDAAVDDAAAGTAVAHAATLVGYEIQGLAAHALALSRLGNHSAEAGALVHRALELLDHQRYLEGSEEQVLVACVEVLRGAGADDRADLVLERARRSARTKLGALVDPAWRAAYLALPEIYALLG